VDRPSKDDLLNELLSSSFVAVGKKYGVSDNTIRKWCISYGLPSKASEINKIYKTKQDKKPYKTSVEQLDPETNEVIAIFESANAAARSLGKNKGNHITEVCKGKNLKAYGYKWRYAEGIE